MEKVLLIEDNEHIMNINSQYLTKMGYLVQSAYSLKQAESVMRGFVPDLIVLDIMLPDGDGLDFCKKIRRSHNTPILFLTAKSSQKNIIDGLDNGGDDYLTQPYDLNVFGSRVKALLRRAGKTLPENQIYIIGSLILDIVRSQAFVGEYDLKLSGKEFGILLYLAQHRGSPVSKQELYRTVWGYEDENDGSIVWAAVSRLNKKIAAYEDLFYIESDRDGYELVIIGSGEYR